MKKQLSFFGIGCLLFVGILVASNITFVPTYDSNINEQKIAIKAEKTFSISTKNNQNTWYIGIDKKDISEKDNICVTWKSTNQESTECLDTEHTDNTGEYYSFPVFTKPTNTITVSIQDEDNLLNDKNIHIYSLNSLPIGKKIAWKNNIAHADNGIISRSEWGADETLRYVTHPKQQEAFKKQLDYAARPKTEKELKTIENNNAINSFIKKHLGNEFETTSLTRKENGNRLVWPIQKVKKVNKIIIHHTAETFSQYLSDEERIRSIYLYHSVTRGWGDIGYNYIMGKDGKIYEGRAGGDYVVGAHASYNNIGSVGISVLGNYEEERLNPEQEASLKRFIEQTAQKYGITLTDTVTGFKKCKTKDCYPLQIVKTPALIGHKDVGVTSCPGKHIYEPMQFWRKQLSQKLSPVINTEKGFIEAKPLDEEINLEKKVTSNPFKNTLESIKNISNKNITPEKYFGQKMRVRLSYPHNEITLKSYTPQVGTLFLDYKRQIIENQKNISISPYNKNQLKVTIDGKNHIVKTFSFGAPVVEISSWKRIPEWDIHKKYNDNLFRDTIEIWNENGQIFVVNHLPLEWYLKGLGEVSNDDLPEKIKTITVAARGYAKYYMQRENRKYHTNRYDGSDDPNSFQKYIGYSYEIRSPKVSKIVDQTQGEVIYYKNQLIKPWYFSASSGRTLSYKEYCLKSKNHECEDIPYLQSVSDPAGNNKKSSGHGVGISGIGATDFAKKGWKYKDIIKYYLPGVEIKP